MSKNTASIMGVEKGQIKIGYDGDLAIVDIDKEYEISHEAFVSKGKNTPFSGMKVYGDVIKTIKGGKVVFSKN